MPLVSLGISFAICLILMPIIRQVCLRFGYVAKPREDRWHRKPTAILGGVGIFSSFIIGLIASTLGGGSGQIPWGIVAGAATIFFLGLIDDIRPISPTAKLVGQIVAATIVISLGYTTEFFSPRIPNENIAQMLNIILTYIWIIIITNAINLLDNMDGLAGGISLIAASILSYFFWSSGEICFLIFSLALAGSLAGFLIYNFPPASIFMGDSGSLFIGFTLAVLSIARQPQASNVFAILGVPTLIFLLPILDTGLVTFTRIISGRSPVQGGSDHTSHRLISFGLSERQAVLALYGIALVAGLLAAVLESVNYWLSLFLVPFIILSLSVLIGYIGGVTMKDSTHSSTQKRTFSRLILDLTFRRRVLEIILDFFLIVVSYYLAFLTRYGFDMNESRLDLYLRTLPIALGGTFISFFVLGVYKGVWRYLDIYDLTRFFRAAVGSFVFVATGIFLLFTIGDFENSSDNSPIILLLFAVFIFLELGITRSSFKVLDFYFGQQIQTEEIDVVICGAGDMGEMALRWIIMNPQLNLKPVGFLDEDPFLRGRQIHGVAVLGKVADIETILDNHAVGGVIIADSYKMSEAKKDLIAICKDAGCWIKHLRLEFEEIE